MSFQANMRFVAFLAFLALLSGADAKKKKKSAESDEASSVEKTLMAAKYGEAQLLVTVGAKAGGSYLYRASAEYPKVATGSVVAKDGQHFHVLFDVTAPAGEGFNPHQAFIRLTNKATGKTSIFVAHPDSTTNADRKGLHKFSVDLSDRKALYEAADGGDFTVDVLIGDSSISNPVVWSVGSVSLQPRAPVQTPTPPLYSTPLLLDSDNTLVPLKEISHIFRQPDSRPPAVVSLVFTGIVLFVFAIWLLSTLRLGLSFRIPLASFPWAVGFFASFGAILALFILYWYNLTMFTTLGYLTILSVPTVLFGRQLLVSLQAEDDAAASKNA